MKSRNFEFLRPDLQLEARMEAVPDGTETCGRLVEGELSATLLAVTP